MFERFSGKVVILLAVLLIPLEVSAHPKVIRIIYPNYSDRVRGTVVVHGRTDYFTTVRFSFDNWSSPVLRPYRSTRYWWYFQATFDTSSVPSHTSLLTATAADGASTSILLRVDNEPPPVIRDLSARRREGGVEITWSAPPDDAFHPVEGVQRYVIKYSRFPIDGDNFGEASILPVYVKPGQPGLRERVVTDNVPAEANYVAIVSIDGVGNISEVASTRIIDEK
ncbi:MAG: hypothetical protein ACUVXI_20030 [bacterium]